LTFSSEVPWGLEQYAADYEEAYTKLAVIRELHSDSAKHQKILINLYDPSNPETKILVSYCQQYCTMFEDVVDHLTDTHIRDTHYNTKHSARKPKLSRSTFEN
jgi:hypothetical protein